MRSWILFGLASATVVLGAGCAPGSNVPDLESIGNVPPFVLTVNDLTARVQRTPDELVTRTSGVQVVGVLVRRAAQCDISSPVHCEVGPQAKYWFSDAPTGGRPIPVLLVAGGDDVREGQRYVLDGSVEVAPDVPQRWQLRAQVLARVRE